MEGARCQAHPPRPLIGICLPTRLPLRFEHLWILDYIGMFMATKKNETNKLWEKKQKYNKNKRKLLQSKTKIKDITKGKNEDQ